MKYFTLILFTTIGFTAFTQANWLTALQSGQPLPATAPTEVAELLPTLTPILKDTLVDNRRRAYQLLQQRAQQKEVGMTDRQQVVSVFVEQLVTEETSVRGTLLQYLQQYEATDFSATSRAQLATHLAETQRSHFDQLVQLAGFLQCTYPQFFVDAIHQLQISLVFFPFLITVNRTR